MKNKNKLPEDYDNDSCVYYIYTTTIIYIYNIYKYINIYTIYYREDEEKANCMAVTESSRIPKRPTAVYSSSTYTERGIGYDHSSVAHKLLSSKEKKKSKEQKKKYTASVYETI